MFSLATFRYKSLSIPSSPWSYGSLTSAMEAVAAFSLASNVLQVIDFAANIVSRGHKLYISADGRVEEHAVLDAALNNLTELYNTLQSTSSHKARRTRLKATPTDRQLIKLQNESEKIVKDLRSKLETVRISGPHRKWQSIYQALRSVSSDKEISRLASKLQSIRKEVDTAILVSLRHSIEDLRYRSGDDADSRNRDGNKLKEQLEEILVAIRENDWQGSNREDVNAFSKVLDVGATQNLKSRFCTSILARLYYRQLRDRAEAIPPAFKETFEWVFGGDPSSDAQTGPQSFANWLQRDDSSIYWITGKPGSGKSTLMKYISGDGRLPSLLAKWANGQTLTHASFYFWNSGSLMQMSRFGLFQALVYTCLEGNEDLIIETFAERWDQFKTFGGGRDPMEWLELRRAFNHIIADQSKKFFFAIDGLDEFDGEPKEIIELIFGVSRSNVKLCLSSRPWLPFEDAFHDRPSLLVEELTKKDISTFVHGHFTQDVGFLRLQRSEPAAAAALLDNLVEKASGVFLWVHLVVQSLLEGLSNSDHMSDLQDRLDALPGDLEALFNKILERLEPEYFKQACETFRLLRTHRTVFDNGTTEVSPTLLSMYFADGRDTTTSRKYKHLTENDIRSQVETMRRRLNARCRGFIEIDRNIVGSSAYSDRRISYLHRTARDFIESENYWPTVLRSTGHSLFKPEERWAMSYIRMYKSMPAVSYGNQLLGRCVQIARALQESTGLVQKSYLDQICEVRSKFRNSVVWPPTELVITRDISRSSLSGISGYLALALKTATPEQVKQFLHYAKSGYTLTEDDDFAKVLRYYSKSRYRRWFHRKLILAAYE
ncbi:hypothetical protein FB567DRAFT_525324 [Paraphoma chrysanthemicola]|uniref:NACHT domain-containing protein n=1 Tax=Paraphoma chrysanthemicola TaxID=798071 RepID=A0A8K0VYV1_9PLEO|nr:hypothetical protein FB567DRAFT_525324 [Paraphoma chrysanthemicola]